MAHRKRYKHNQHVLHSNKRTNIPRANRQGADVVYSVLKCRPVIARSSPQLAHEHLQVLVTIDGNANAWMTINVRSGQDQVLFFLDEHYQHPVLQRILDAELNQGFTPIEKKAGGIALDYQRDKLVDLEKMNLLGDGVDDDFSSLEEMLTTQLTNAFRFEDSRMFVFGSHFHDGKRFSSYNLDEGIHDIHMNQGSVGGHKKSNGVWQDGGLFIHYPSENRWSAVFLKFASQSNHTDENGN